MTDDSWLNSLDAEDQQTFMRELGEVLGKTEYSDLPENLALFFTAWENSARALADPETREALTAAQLGDFEGAPSLRPTLRHHYRYAYQRCVDKVWTNHCGKCDRPQHDAIHISAAGVDASREGARFQFGDRVRDPEHVEWFIKGVADHEYVMRHAYHESGEVWHDYVWDRSLTEKIMVRTTGPDGPTLTP